MRCSILFIFLFCLQKVSAQTIAEIRQFHIYRVDVSTLFRGKPYINSIFYDSSGRVVKEIEEAFYDASKFVTLKTYLNDSLVKEINVDTFYKEKFAGRTTILYDYVFDKDHRITSKLSRKSNGELTKECFVYKTDGRLDTIFIFRNDTTLWTGNPFIGTQQLKKDLSLKRIKAFSYHDDTTFEKDCCTPILEFDKTCCKGFVKISNDTLESSIETSWGLTGCILNSTETVSYNKTLKNKNGDYYFEDSWGNKTYCTEYKNKKGLVVKRISKQANTDGKTTISKIKWKYYYRT